MLRQFFQSAGDLNGIGDSNVEQTVATRCAAFPALHVLRIFQPDAGKPLIDSHSRASRDARGTPYALRIVCL
jgi:hypothetical protein